MKQTFAISRFFYSTLLLAIFGSLIFGTTSCGDDEEEMPDGCANVSTLDGTAEVDGSTFTLTIAQLLVSNFVDEDSYNFQLAAIANNCNELRTINFIIDIPEGTQLGGTYPFVDFFDSTINDATGSYISQILDPISQTLFDINGGMVTVVNNGGNNFDLDIDATLVGGEQVTFVLSHQF